jgi:membrane-associated HD superfamily phosphohydrolase
MKKGDAFLSTVFLFFSILFGVLSFSLKSSNSGSLGPSGWPLLICIFIFLCTVIFLLLSFKSDKTLEIKEKIFSREKIRVYFSIVALIVYFFIMIYFGFFVSTVCMLFGFILYFGNYKWYTSLASSLLITGVVYFIFSTVLNVSFKFGMFF